MNARAAHAMALGDRTAHGPWPLALTVRSVSPGGAPEVAGDHRDVLSGQAQP
jgi:hypothetical protein